MKTRTILALTLVLSFVLGGIAMAASVDPVFYEMCRDAGQHPDDPIADECITTGDAFYECNQIGEYDWAKRVSAENNTWPLVDHGLFIQDVTIANSNGLTFDWEVSDHPLGSVLVKSVGKGMLSGGYNVYTYPDDWEMMSDTDLSGVTMYKEMGKDGSQFEYDFDINHITFCWNAIDDNGDDICVEDETAWAAGLPYVEQGNWAMYVDYYAQEAPFTVDLLAGQDMVAGTVTFSAPVDGWVDITIQLGDDWVFYHDVDDIEADDNIKIQDYQSPPPPVNPAIGHFDWKASIDPGETDATISVPLKNYYAVHVGLGHAVECPVEE